MKHQLIQVTLLLLAMIGEMQAAESTATRPNVLFVIADDAPCHFGQTFANPRRS